VNDPAPPSPAPAVPPAKVERPQKAEPRAEVPWHGRSWYIATGGAIGSIGLIVTIAAWLIPMPNGSAPPAPPPSSLADGTAPITATVAVNKSTCDGATSYHVVPPDQVASVQPYSNVRHDSAFRNAPDAIYTDVVVTLQGNSGVATVLQRITVHVTSREKPAGAAFQNGERECGSISPAFLGINLDRTEPHAVSLPGRHGEPARPFPFTISSSDPEVFHLYGVTHACDCRWYVDIEWSSAGVTGTMKIDDNGQPFRTVGTDGIQVTSVTEELTSWTPAKYPPYSPMG
jgi:hypothetical protein